MPVPRVAVPALGAVVAGGDLLALGWLGPRAGVVAAAVVVAAVLVWWPVRWRRVSPVAAARGAVVAAGVAVVVAATGLRRAGAEGRTERVADRIAGRDLPPVAAYGVVVTGLVLLCACAVLARGARPDPRGGRAPRLRPLLAAGLAVAVTVAGAVVASAAGSLAHAVADRWSDVGEVSHTRSRDAVRLDERPGPAPPARLAWENDLSSPASASSASSPGERSTLLAARDVPGWDAVLAVVEDADLDVARTRIVAFSKTDGAELWSRERPGWYGGVAVDAAAGRVLTLYHDAVEVLDLRDGSEVATRSLPEVDDGPGGWYLVGDGVQSLGTAPTDAARVVVGPAATILGTPATPDGRDPPRLGVVDVSSGRLVDSAEVSASCVFTADTAGSSPVVLQSGSGHRDRCGDPTVWTLDDSRGLVPLAEIPPPPTGPGALDGCDLFCGQARVLATRDAILVGLVWDDDGDAVSDLAVLAADGAERWRASDRSGRPLPGPVELVSADGDRVIAGWDDHWRALSLADGAELARRPEEAAGSRSTVADAERFYYQPGGAGAGRDEVSVRRIDTLELLGEIAPGPPGGSPEHPLFSTAGHLVNAHDGGFAAYATYAVSEVDARTVTRVRAPTG